MASPMVPADTLMKDPDTPSNRVMQLPIIEVDPAGEIATRRRDLLVHQQKSRLPPRCRRECLELRFPTTVLPGEGPRSDWWNESISGPARLAAIAKQSIQRPPEAACQRGDAAMIVGIGHRWQDSTAMIPPGRVTGSFVESFAEG